MQLQKQQWLLNDLKNFVIIEKIKNINRKTLERKYIIFFLQKLKTIDGATLVLFDSCVSKI